jgi:hypothetical protein
MIEFKESSQGNGNLPAVVGDGPQADDSSEMKGKLTAVGWDAPRGADMPLEDWLDEGARLRGRHVALLFAVGDWLQYGEKKYGETYAQAEAVTGYKPEFLSRCKWIAKKVSKKNRVATLSFKHHAAVASLDEKTQDAFLQLAQFQGMTADETRAAVQEAKATGEVDQPEGKKRGRKPKAEQAEPQTSDNEDQKIFPRNNFDDEVDDGVDRPSVGFDPTRGSPQPEVEASVEPITTAVGQFYDQLVSLGEIIGNWRIPALAEEIKRQANWDEHREVINDVHAALYRMLKIIDGTE